MKHIPRWLSLTRLIPLAFAAIALHAQAEEDPRLEQSRDIVRAFGSELKGQLQAAMAAGGPAAAIRVCKDVAPAVASKLSRRHGAQVSRTSLRVRNPANLPTGWQTRVLQGFDERAASGADGPFEHADARASGRFRYMQAIPTGGVCLACHGSDVPADVQALLDDEYPHDRARGYAPGDIRGAFSVVWPAGGDD